MPLARLRVERPEEAAPFADRLRTMGYEVVFLAPGETPDQPADLELQFESCDLAEAMTRAAGFARSHPEGEISVAAGVLPPLPERQNAISSALATITGGLKEAQLQISQAWREHFEHAMERQARWAERRHQASDEAQRRREEQRARQESLRQKRDEDRRLQLEREAEAARQGEELRRRQAEELEGRRLAREAEVARRNREAEAEVLRMAEQATYWDEVGDKAAPTAATPAEFAPEPVATPEPVAPAIVPVAPVAPAPVAVPATVLARAARRDDIVMLPRGRQWRFAMVAAAVVAVGLMIGWAVAGSPRPAAPLSNHTLMQSNGLQQQVPFGPVTIKAYPATATSSPAALAANQPVAHAAATPKPPATIAAPTPAPKHRVTIQSKARARHSSGSYDPAEPEVVVRHFGPQPHPPHAGQQAKATAKRISDLQ